VKQLSVDADVVAAGICFGTKLGDDLTVDLDPAFGDHLLGMTAAGYASPGKDFLQPFEFGRWTRLGREACLFIHIGNYRGDFGVGSFIVRGSRRWLRRRLICGY
jgi:hypothetical protein